MSTQFENVTLNKKSNVYFDGKAISHDFIQADGSKKSVGVIQPATLTFNTSVDEIMEIVAGECRVKIAGEVELKNYTAGQSFNVPANSSFELEALTVVDYVCHYG